MRLTCALTLGISLFTAGAVRADQNPPAQPPPATSGPTLDDEFAPEYWKDYRIGLSLFPIGPVVPEGRLRLSNYIPVHPVGFPTDQYYFGFTPTYGLGDGWEVTVGGDSAERLGPGGQAFFFGGGIQKQLMRENGDQPFVSIGAYGLAGPHDFQSQSVYLSASKRVVGTMRSAFAAFAHGGVKYDRFDSNDVGRGDGVRPYFGASTSYKKRFFLSGEVSPAQSWQRATPFNIQATYVVMIKGHTVGVSGGVESAGYRTLPFIGVSF